MGQAASQEEIESVGYRVLGVQPNSPAASAGLVSFFDFVVAANNYPLKILDQKFVEMIKEAENRPLPLTIFNIKSETTRDVIITPQRNWGGQGMLGVTIRFDSFWRADEALVRVLEVLPDSPAELAGLEANNDYLLGTAEVVFKDTETLYEEVKKSLDSTTEFYVYNTEKDTVRVVVIMPTYNWNGEGCLGLSVGHGLLHRLPHRCKQSTGTSIEPARQVPNLRDATASPVPKQAPAAPPAASPSAPQHPPPSAVTAAPAAPPSPAVPTNGVVPPTVENGLPAAAPAAAAAASPAPLAVPAGGQ